MNIEAQKEQLINWISQLDDSTTLQNLLNIKKKNVANQKKRSFGCGKGIFTYIAPDFNEPLSEFQEYTR